jgi:hypothetical protein
VPRLSPGVTSAGFASLVQTRASLLCLRCACACRLSSAAATISVPALLRSGRYRRGVLPLARGAFLASVSAWAKYLDHAYPGVKRPAGTPG